MTLDQLVKRFPHVSRSVLARNASDYPAVAPRLPDPEPQRANGKEQIRHDAEEKGSPARVAVVVTRCSTGSLDRDNLIGGAKATCDGLRYFGYIAGDTEQDIELFVLQKKVKRKHVGTLIEIIPL